MKILRTALLLGIATAISCNMNNESFTSEGYIGRNTITIEDGVMSPEALLALGRISDPQVSPDGQHILYGVSYQSTEENRSCRNLYICNIDGTQSQELTHSGKSISNARWSNDGKHIAFAMGGQIWTADIECTGKGWELSNINKVSDIPAGIGEFKLSPDQDKVMYISYVKSHVKAPTDCYKDLDKATAYSTDDLMYRHWDHTVMEIPHTFVADFCFAAGSQSITPEKSIDLLAGEAELYELPTEPFGGLEQLSWSPDGKYIAYSCRKLTGKKYAFSTNTDIYIYNIETAECKRIECAGGYDTEPLWSPDGSKLAWLSMERDGYEADKVRIMVADIAASAEPQVTSLKELTEDFKYNASGLTWAEDSQSIYFAALAEGLQAIYQTDLTGKITRLTADNLWYDFGSPFHIVSKEDGSKTLYTTWCSMDFPTEFVAVNLPADKARAQAEDCTQISDENGHILSQLAEHQTEARMVKTVDGKDMLTWVLYPPQFDPAKKYPSILICLGGPQGTLSQGWSYRWNYRLMCSQGYIVVLPNRRGTTAFGQEWTEQISGDYPGLNMQDYLAAAKELKAEPYVDKMAACGASYGGYSIYYLCGTHNNTFDAFVAHAGIFNEEHMYMTTEEMWFANFDNGGMHEAEFDKNLATGHEMIYDKEKAALSPIGPKGDGQTFGGIRQGGSPWSNKPEAVRHYRLSPHKLVTNWDTPLFVIHGGMDYRVPMEQGMAAYNAAQLMGVPSRFLLFPDENHWILKPQNALLWHREYFKWLDHWCK